MPSLFKVFLLLSQGEFFGIISGLANKILVLYVYGSRLFISCRFGWSYWANYFFHWLGIFLPVSAIFVALRVVYAHRSSFYRCSKFLWLCHTVIFSDACKRSLGSPLPKLIVTCISFWASESTLERCRPHGVAVIRVQDQKLLFSCWSAFLIKYCFRLAASNLIGRTNLLTILRHNLY